MEKYPFSRITAKLPAGNAPENAHENEAIPIYVFISVANSSYIRQYKGSVRPDPQKAQVGDQKKKICLLVYGERL